MLWLASQVGGSGLFPFCIGGGGGGTGADDGEGTIEPEVWYVHTISFKFTQKWNKIVRWKMV